MMHDDHSLFLVAVERSMSMSKVGSGLQLPAILILTASDTGFRFFI